MSDHQLIFCTRKIKRAKFNKYKNVFLRSFKNCTVNVFVEELQKVNFSNYGRVSCIDAAYTDFLHKLSTKFKILLGKKKRVYETKLRQKMNKPKELWKTLRSIGLSSKVVTVPNISLKDQNEIVFNANKKMLHL